MLHTSIKSYRPLYRVLQTYIDYYRLLRSVTDLYRVLQTSIEYYRPLSSDLYRVTVSENVVTLNREMKEIKAEINGFKTRFDSIDAGLKTLVDLLLPGA